MSDFVIRYCPNCHHSFKIILEDIYENVICECGWSGPACKLKFEKLKLAGVGPDAPLTTNDKGGKESATPYRFDLLPPLACAEVSKILAHGAEKYGEWNWLKLDAKTSLNHALQHCFAYIAGDTQEGDRIEHARHAACRILFWLDLLERENQNAPVSE